MPVGIAVRRWMAVRARRLGLWPVARRLYARLVRDRPDDFILWHHYGLVLSRTRRLPEALVALEQSDRLMPGRASAHLRMGEVLVRMGRPRRAGAHYARAAKIDPALEAAQREAERLLPRPAGGDGLPRRIRYLNIGTTSICNASCIHCPTGKAATAHVPRMPMPMALFRKLLDGIAALDLPITDQIGFGLFGDALADPLVVQRAEYARKLFPAVELVVNTNGAAFDPRRHAALREFSPVISLHCESLVPEVYDHLMQPLRAARVFPKYEALLAAFPNTVNISMPVSRLNLPELETTRDWFLRHGARSVVFDPMSSRCAEDRALFTSLALNPVRIRCAPNIMNDLTIDADGQVLICCQDFQRVEGIGDLARNSVREVLTSLRRQEVRRMLAEGRHDELATCSRCYGDLRTSVEAAAPVPAAP